MKNISIIISSVFCGLLLILSTGCKVNKSEDEKVNKSEDEIIYNNNNTIVFNPDLEYGKVKDIDGNTYKTIQIGTQNWMAENLKTTKYNDGSSILMITDTTTWDHDTPPSYCWYNYDISNKNDYGALYNGFVINSKTNGNKSICPSGWHIPSRTEWLTLFKYLNNDSVSDWHFDADNLAKKLTETGDTHWRYLIVGATNSSGFTAIPGGSRYPGSPGWEGFNGFNKFNDIIRRATRYWCSEPIVIDASPCFAIYRFDNKNRVDYDYALSNSFYFSVRCLKD